MISRHAIGAARKDGGLDPWVRLGRFSAKFKEHNYLFFVIQMDQLHHQE